MQGQTNTARPHVENTVRTIIKQRNVPKTPASCSTPLPRVGSTVRPTRCRVPSPCSQRHVSFCQYNPPHVVRFSGSRRHRRTLNTRFGPEEEGSDGRRELPSPRGSSIDLLATQPKIGPGSAGLQPRERDRSGGACRSRHVSDRSVRSGRRDMEEWWRKASRSGLDMTSSPRSSSLD